MRRHLGRIIAGIIIGVTTGLVLYWLIPGGNGGGGGGQGGGGQGGIGPGGTGQGEGPRPASFLERVSGDYTLVSWQRTPGPIDLGVRVKDGTLHIDGNGDADWDLGIWDSALRPDPPPGPTTSRIRCGGTVVGESQTLEWAPGGNRNEAINWTDGIRSVRDRVELAFSGATDGGRNAPFTLSLDEQSSGRKLLEMRNSEGTFRWEG